MCFDFQLEGEIALADDKFLGYGAWFATGAGSEDFSETGVKLTYTQDINSWQYYASLIYKEQNNSLFDSGLEGLASLRYYFAESEQSSHSISAILSYDNGAEGFYGAIEYNNYIALNKDSYISLKTGISAASDYYERDGLNDLYARLSYTYNLTKQVSLTPYIGTSIQLDGDNEENSNFLFGGLWFEVSF